MVIDWPFITLLFLFPLFGAAVCLMPFFGEKYDPQGRLCRMWAIAISLMTLGFVVALSRFIAIGSSAELAMLGGAPSIKEIYPWLPSFGINFCFQLDGLSYPFCLLTCLISLAVIVWTTRAPTQAPSQSGKGSARAWYCTMLAAQGAVLGAFLATDLLLFYVFYELMLLPVIVGVAVWGGPQRLQAVFKFVLYTLAGSVMMFVAILYCGWKAKSVGAYSFDLTQLLQPALFTRQEQLWLGAAFVLAFAVKIPIVPFHSWAPDLYREAPHGVGAFVAALLGKVGIYGILRFAWPLFPAFVEEYGAVVAGLGAVSVAFGALVAMYQKDIRTLLAYSSVSHLGFCVLGLSSASQLGIAGAIYQSFSHGLVTAALFLSLGVVMDARGSRHFVDFGGLAARLPIVAFFLMVFSIAGVALPLTSSFVGEFMILLGAYEHFPAFTIVAMSGVVFGAVYTLTAYLRLMFGVDRCTEVTKAADVGGVNRYVLAALSAIIIVLGVYPKPLFTVFEPAVKQLLSTSHERGRVVAAADQLTEPSIVLSDRSLDGSILQVAPDENSIERVVDGRVDSPVSEHGKVS